MLQYCVNSLISLYLYLLGGGRMCGSHTRCNLLYTVLSPLCITGIQLCCKPKPWTSGGKATRIKPSCLFHMISNISFSGSAATNRVYCLSGWYYTRISWPYSCSPCWRVPLLHRCQWCNTAYSKKKSTSSISCGNIRTILLFCSLQSS